MSTQNIFKFLTTILLAAVILSACGPAAETPVAATEAPVATEPPAPTEAPVATEAPATEAAVLSGKVTIWMWKAAHDALTNSGVLDEFKKIHPDVKVEIVEYQPADVYQKLPLA